jgi:ABC-2 type transport system ATP-binding protein
VADQPAILAEDLTKCFGPVPALAGVDLVVPAGSVLGLLGPNGAGKTTLVRVLTTLLNPDGGRAFVQGFDVVARPGAVRKVIGLSGQYAAVDAYLSGRENLRMIGRLCRLSRAAARRRADELVDLFGLGEAADRMARTYSGGMRRRLDVAASLVGTPAVLFLDEPTSGLDPRGRLGLWQLLGDLVADGTTLLLTTQYLEEADHVADTLVVIDAGRVIAAGSPEELKARIGGDRLELRVRPGGDLRELARALDGLGSGPGVLDEALGRLVLPVVDASAVVSEVAARVAAAGVPITDLALRRPSLDDVFLTLTGTAIGETGSLPTPAWTGSAVTSARRI